MNNPYQNNKNNSFDRLVNSADNLFSVALAFASTKAKGRVRKRSAVRSGGLSDGARDARRSKQGLSDFHVHR